ncbi:MAG: hypothetical protein A2Y38_00405 [Spirochaetes bacterium GWB1_59_5]|nr:MAG: hypothetical protein A2Y38_00405 [Spirochaetes bacterium GWB1_59_5]
MAFLRLHDVTPLAMQYFVQRHDLSLLSLRDKPDLSDVEVLFFSLHSWRDFYDIARLPKAPGQIWIAGGPAVYSPIGVSHRMDYIHVGDGVAAMQRMVQGEFEGPGTINTHCMNTVQAVEEPPQVCFDSRIVMSVGCKRKCAFCVNAWRRKYVERPESEVVEFLQRTPYKGVSLLSNSSDDVSYYANLTPFLQGKSDMVVSNHISAITEAFAASRSREVLLGIEGMSERLRASVLKPCPAEKIQKVLLLLFNHGVQARTVFQFNLPTETLADLEELRTLVHEIQPASKGSWAIPFIPHQPSPHTPLQWSTPTYSIPMAEAIMDFRQSMFGSKDTGVGVYVPAPLYPGRWFAQQVAEWLPVTPEVADAVEALPRKAAVPEMIEFLAKRNVRLPEAFLDRNEHTVFPWDCVEVRQPKARLWQVYEQLQKIRS